MSPSFLAAVVKKLLQPLSRPIWLSSRTAKHWLTSAAKTRIAAVIVRLITRSLRLWITLQVVLVESLSKARMKT
jgi:hypothetical protein